MFESKFVRTFSHSVLSLLGVFYLLCSTQEDNQKYIPKNNNSKLDKRPSTFENLNLANVFDIPKVMTTSNLSETIVKNYIPNYLTKLYLAWRMGGGHYKGTVCNTFGALIHFLEYSRIITRHHVNSIVNNAKAQF